MSTVTLDVKTLENTLADFAATWKSGEADGEARISFASPDLLWRVLTAKRWDLLKAMTGQPPMALREAARRVGRDVKAVHADAHALLDAGVLRKEADGKISFPFDAVRVEFMLKAA
jgi:predicted transcriptional regulator